MLSKAITNSIEQNLQSWREMSINRILPVTAIVAAPAVIGAIYNDIQGGTGFKWPIYIVFYAILAVIAFMRGIKYMIKVGLLLVLTFVLGVYLLYSIGLGDGELFLVAFSVLASFYFGRKYGIISISASVIVMVVFSIWKSAGNMADFSSWISSTVIVLLIASLLVYSSELMLSKLIEAINQSGQATKEIENRLEEEKKQKELLLSTVGKYMNHMTSLVEGNLTKRIDTSLLNLNPGDPLWVLGQQLNDTTAGVQKMITQIRQSSTNLGSASSEILAATTQQVSGASEQSAAISQTTTTVDEVKTLSVQAIERAQEVVSASQRTVDISSSGQQSVNETVEAMALIKERVEGIAENIVALSEQTQQIGEIIATVNDIASQSNMLALNASIEAARAGEHGKGFAAVALEVRNLAEQSKLATSQVKNILTDIQDAINAAVMATEEGTKVVDAGVKMAARTGEVITQLTSAITDASQTSMQVMAGGRQQASGVEQIALAMQNINQATVQGLSSTRQAEKAAQDLNNLATQLTDIVQQYKV